MSSNTFIKFHNCDSVLWFLRLSPMCGWGRLEKTGKTRWRLKLHDEALAFHTQGTLRVWGLSCSHAKQQRLKKMSLISRTYIFKPLAAKYFHIINAHGTDVKMKTLHCWFRGTPSFWPSCAISQFKLPIFGMINDHMWLGFQYWAAGHPLLKPLQWHIICPMTHLSFWKSLAETLHDENLKAWTVTRKCDDVQENNTGSVTFNLLWIAVSVLYFLFLCCCCCCCSFKGN